MRLADLALLFFGIGIALGFALLLDSATEGRLSQAIVDLLP